MRLIFCLAVLILTGCSKPIDTLLPLKRMAIVSVTYDPNIYYFHPHSGIDSDRMYAPFSGDPSQSQIHEMMLNEFLIDVMSDTVKRSGISIVRPLQLLNTSLMQDNGAMIRYEYLLDPYDPIDISNQVFMAGIAKKLMVDAVVQIQVSFAVHLDEKMLWQEYKDPYAETLNSYRMQVRRGHETSRLRTTVSIVVVDKNADTIYNESRFVDTDSDQVHVDDRDLSFDGGISPKLLRLGLDQWLNDWVSYLPEVYED